MRPPGAAGGSRAPGGITSKVDGVNCGQRENSTRAASTTWPMLPASAFLGESRPSERMHADSVFEFLCHLWSLFVIYEENRANLSVLFCHLWCNVRCNVWTRDSNLWRRGSFLWRTVVGAISTAGASALKSLTHPTGGIQRARALMKLLAPVRENPRKVHGMNAPGCDPG